MWLGLAGGAASRFKDLIDEDRLEQTRKQSQMLTVMLPEVMEQRRLRRDKKGRYREYHNQLRNLGMDENISRSILESGEDWTKTFIKETQEHMLTEDSKLQSLKELKDAGIITDTDYEGRKVDRNFDDWFDQNIVGIPNSKSNRINYDQLKLATAKHYGMMSPDMLKGSVYQDMVSITGADISSIAADVEGEREKVYTERLRVLLPQDAAKRLVGLTTEAATEHHKFLQKEIKLTDPASGKPRTFDNSAQATVVLGHEAVLAKTYRDMAEAREAMYDASGLGKNVAGFKDFMNDAPNSFNKYSKAVSGMVGVEWRINAAGEPQFMFGAKTAPDQKQALQNVLTQVTSVFYDKWEVEGRLLVNGNFNPHIKQGVAYKNIASVHKILGALATSAAQLDALYGRNNTQHKDIIRDVISANQQSAFDTAYDDAKPNYNEPPKTGGLNRAGGGPPVVTPPSTPNKMITHMQNAINTTDSKVNYNNLRITIPDAFASSKASGKLDDLLKNDTDLQKLSFKKLFDNVEFGKLLGIDKSLADYFLQDQGDIDKDTVDNIIKALFG